MPPAARPIVFLSDFGLSNEWVGICHAVMSRIAPASRIVDLSHLVPPLNILSGALLLADSLNYLAEARLTEGSRLPLRVMPERMRVFE